MNKNNDKKTNKNNDASTSLFNIAVNGDHNIQGSWIERCLKGVVMHEEWRHPLFNLEQPPEILGL